uniref:Neprosin PEP catalytic domain-containing protein n=2 Tax=Phaseolus vulgaris TaxID=3885 RepID=V7BBQ5_PHAVU|nr:hypothetical protein PHAVU_008G236300g [Phaseolus vulgaris]ESW13906.1 hypothetical protein PHAVU_008G236300g [Phaseolus vulgaris]
MKNSSNVLIFGLGKEKCPKGTVPIRRTTKNDLIQGRSLLYSQSMVQGYPGFHNAELYLIPNFGPYYKVSGRNSIYNPRVLRNDQTSISNTWVQNGHKEGTNKISFGWHVAPRLHGGDTATYLYAAWTSDNFKKTGCYNVHCSGFVQIHQGTFLGGRISNSSLYGGTSIEFLIQITQDPNSKNWWLNIQGEDIGYFPAKLFSNMASADQVGWGGRTVTPPNTPSPQMGSGYFPDKNFSHACYFRFISFQNDSRTDYGPPLYLMNTFVDKSNCFNAKYYGDLGGTVGYSLQFGGPGGDCGN